MTKQIVAHEPVQGEPADPGDRTQVLIFDAMPEAQSLKKKPTTTKLVHLKEQFCSRIKKTRQAMVAIQK